jgi:hypothetical protein
MAKPKKGPARKPAPRKPPRKATPRKEGEHEGLARRIAEALGISPAEAVVRALRDLAERVAPAPPAPAEEAHSRAEAAHVEAVAPRSGLPERLYLLLDGRGLDGRGMPVEVIDLPTVVGSERHCTVWVNSPQIETRHVQFTRDDGEWYVEDLGSTHGTFLGDQRIARRRVEDGDEYRLAGYLRLRVELR